MDWHFCLFPGRLVSCCKIQNFIARYVISYIHFHNPKSLLLSPQIFCNFRLLHKHMAGSQWDNENVSKTPSGRKSKSRHLHLESTFQHVGQNPPLVSKETIILWYAGHTAWKHSGAAWEEGVIRGRGTARCGRAKTEAEVTFFVGIQQLFQHVPLSLLPTVHSPNGTRSSLKQKRPKSPPPPVIWDTCYADHTLTKSHRACSKRDYCKQITGEVEKRTHTRRGAFNWPKRTGLTSALKWKCDDICPLTRPPTGTHFNVLGLMGAGYIWKHWEFLGVTQGRRFYPRWESYAANPLCLYQSTHSVQSKQCPHFKVVDQYFTMSPVLHLRLQWAFRQTIGSWPALFIPHSFALVWIHAGVQLLQTTLQRIKAFQHICALHPSISVVFRVASYAVQ